MGQIDFPTRDLCFPIGETQFPNFPKNLSRNSPDFPMIPQFPVQFSIQLHKCTLSLSIRPILCILNVSLKIKIPHYARQRIKNLGKFWGILAKSDEKLFIFFTCFPRYEIHFPLIPVISQWLPCKTGKNPCKKKEREFPFPFISTPPPNKFK